MTVRAYDQTEILKLVDFIRARGGDVKYPVQLNNNGGLVLNIVLPKDAQDGWAKAAVAEFEKQR